jgi:hypothetical protein
MAASQRPFDPYQAGAKVYRAYRAGGRPIPQTTLARDTGAAQIEKRTILPSLDLNKEHTMDPNSASKTYFGKDTDLLNLSINH